MAERLRIVIVGGVAGGASAATRARRLSETAEITVFERGPHVSFANCGLPYHVAGVIADRNRLLIQTPESLRARLLTLASCSHGTIGPGRAGASPSSRAAFSFRISGRTSSRMGSLSNSAIQRSGVRKG